MLADRDRRFKVTSGGDGIVRIISAEGTVVDISVDQGVGLPVRTFGTVLSGTVTTNYQHARDRTEYSEWQTVDGIQWPHKIIKFHDDVKRAEITTTEIKLNTDIRYDDLCTKPRP